MKTVTMHEAAVFDYVEAEKALNAAVTGKERLAAKMLFDEAEKHFCMIQKIPACKILVDIQWVLKAKKRYAIA